jgi:superfamily I DNA/RNA helicase
MPTKEEKIATQKKEREECLNKILKSKASKKIIVAGAGTGKTFTFKKVLEVNNSGENIALTFIRMLTSDMFNTFGDLAEVKTFHAFCKKVLHEKNGRVDIYPFLTKIIEEDAKYLKKQLNNFDNKFQLLEEDGEEIKFYLKRGDYYEAVSFNDSVYRLLKLLQADGNTLPRFNQILIDEFQDFNPLEVAFINELEKKGNILIVGDDDQAVYENRNASSTYLIEKFNSCEYEKFELPFCSRCTEVIVEASKEFLKKAREGVHLINRLEKRYECFIESKDEDSRKYPKIITANCTLGSTVAKYVKSMIKNIDTTEIEESWCEGNNYPTVLVVGPRQYLDIVYKKLIDDYPQTQFKQREENSPKPHTAYEILLKDENHNLGWRLLINFFLAVDDIENLIIESEKGKNIVDCLDKQFVEKHKKVLEIIKTIQKGDEITRELEADLDSLVESSKEEIINHFKPKEEERKEEFDKSKPSILLTSFVGCKGLSAGFTFIIGANNGSIPRNPNNITDFEISQFLVAMTRTKKQCHIISNKWLIAPFLNGKRISPFEKSEFISWIPNSFIADKGELKAENIE